MMSKSKFIKIIAMTLIFTLLASSTVMAAPKKSKQSKAAKENEKKIEQMFADMFNAEEYAAMYPEVVKVLGNNKNKLFQHYIKYGILEGLRPSAKVSPISAMIMSAQVKNIVGDNPEGKSIASLLGTIVASDNGQMQDFINNTIATIQSVAETGEAPAPLIEAVEKAINPTPAATLASSPEPEKSSSSSSSTKIESDTSYGTNPDGIGGYGLIGDQIIDAILEFTTAHTQHIAGNVTITRNGELRISGSYLTVSGTIVNNGKITINGGRLENKAPITNNATINIITGEIENDSTITNNATISNSGTINTYEGTIENSPGATINNSGSGNICGVGSVDDANGDDSITVTDGKITNSILEEATISGEYVD